MRSFAVRKEIILGALIKGKKVTIGNEDERDLVHFYNDIVICEKFGRSIDYVRGMRHEDYQNTKLILKKRATYQKIENDKANRKSRSKK